MTRYEADSGLVWDVLRRFGDPATARFEAVLGAAGVDDDTARALRFWHREAVESVRQYAASALPAIWAALAAAQADAEAATARAEQAWQATPVPGHPRPVAVPSPAAAAGGDREPAARREPNGWDPPGPAEPPAVIVLPDAVPETDESRTVAVRLSRIG